MIKIIQSVEQSEQIARAAVGTSLGGSTFAWLGVANEILTTVATVIAIISGLYAIRFYYIRSKNVDAGEEDETE